MCSGSGGGERCGGEGGEGGGDGEGAGSDGDLGWGEMRDGCESSNFERIMRSKDAPNLCDSICRRPVPHQ